MSIRPRRSVLYMPGSNARALEKARTLPVDGVIIDLEDAVAPDAKVEARGRAVETVKAGGFGPRETVIRINGLDTPWGMDDLDAAAAATPDAILVPKVQDPDQLVTVGRRLEALDVAPRTRVWAMIETPIAILDIHAISAARNPLTRLDVFVLGTNDLAKETRAALVPGRAPMVGWLMQVIAGGMPMASTFWTGCGTSSRTWTASRLNVRKGRDGNGRKDADPSEPDRALQPGLQPARGGGRQGPCIMRLSRCRRTSARA